MKYLSTRSAWHRSIGVSEVAGSRSQTGFTLVELLVALAVLGFVAAALAGGLSFGTRVWDKSADQISGMEETSSAQRFLRERISLAFPHYEDTLSQEVFSSISGTDDRLTVATLLPQNLGSRGPYWLTLYAERRGGVNRLMAAWSKDQEGRDPLFEEREYRSLVLLEGIDRMEFAYLGADNFGKAAVWFDAWRNRKAAPELIRVRVSFKDTDERAWPDLMIRPRIDAGVNCVYDPISKKCRGR